jgi:hypothetical protein
MSWARLANPPLETPSRMERWNGVRYTRASHPHLRLPVAGRSPVLSESRQELERSSRHARSRRRLSPDRRYLSPSVDIPQQGS